MSTGRPAAPQTDAELAALLFGPSKTTTRLDVDHADPEMDEAAVRAFLGRSSDDPGESED